MLKRKAMVAITTRQNNVNRDNTGFGDDKFESAN